MKRKRLIQQNAALQFVALAVCGALCLTGCMRDELLSPSSGQPGDGSLVFTVSSQSDWKQTPTTRASGSGGAVQPIQVSGAEKPLYLHTSVQQGIPAGGNIESVMTRGSLREQDDFWDSFSLFGYSYDADEGFSSSGSTPNFLYNLQVKKDGTAYWPYNGTEFQTYFLPAAGTDVTFFAMAPYSDDLLGANDGFTNSTDAIPEATDAGTPTFDYFVPWYATNQQDLCFIRGTKVDGGTSGNVTLTFHHALTAIRVVAAADAPAGEVLAVRILRAPSRGTYTPAVGNTNTGEPGSWTGLNTPGNNDIHHGLANYILSTGQGIRIGTGREVVICGDESTYKGDQGRSNTFFMLPQRLIDNTVLQIIWRPDNASENETLNVPLAGQEWQRGTTVTYRLSQSSVVLDVDLRESTLVGYNGGTYNFDVTATRNGKPLAYGVEFSFDTVNWVSHNSSSLPAMISSISGVGGEVLTVNIGRAPTWASGSSAVTQLRNAPWSPSSNPNGLIKNNESANCYIVSNGGYHRFRTVYGNALSNPTVLSDNYKYVDGAGNSISSAYLPSGITARVIWSDVENLVRINEDPDTDGGPGGITGSGEEQRINIIVGERVIRTDGSTTVNIQPGNALIGAYNSAGTLLWTWHIWVSSDPGSGTAAGTGRRFLRCPIGFVPGGYTEAEGRTCYMRIYVNDDEGNPVYSDPVTIEQTSSGFSSRNLPGRYPTFQWGRMTPMWPSGSDYNNSAGSPLYGDGAPTGIVSRNLGRSQRISQPTVFNNNKDEGSYDSNLWNNAVGNSGSVVQTTQAVSKSLYDPSPAGYHVLQANAFVGGFNDPVTNGAEHSNVPDAIASYARLDVNEEFGIQYNSGIFVPFGGARFASSFLFSNNISYGSIFLYGGSWTAGRDYNNKTLTSVLFFLNYQVTYMGPLMSLWPRYGISTSYGNALTASNPTSCWPVIPQADN